MVSFYPVFVEMIMVESSDMRKAIQRILMRFFNLNQGINGTQDKPVVVEKSLGNYETQVTTFDQEPEAKAQQQHVEQQQITQLEQTPQEQITQEPLTQQPVVDVVVEVPIVQPVEPVVMETPTPSLVVHDEVISESAPVEENVQRDEVAHTEPSPVVEQSIDVNPDVTTVEPSEAEAERNVDEPNAQDGDDDGAVQQTSQQSKSSKKKKKRKQ